MISFLKLSITKSAFFQARKQLSFTTFIELNRLLIKNVYKTSLHYKTWKRFRLCAIDGTSIRLPNETDITEHFGVQKGRGDQADCTMGMASVFYDVLNHMVIDSTIKPRSGSEHKCAAEHLKHADKNDLILYDRGYNAFWLYALHTKHNSAFCMRAKANKNLLVKDFVNSNKKEAVVTFEANKSSVKTCNEKGLPTIPIKLRLVRVDLPNEVEVIITNLMDTSKYEASIFKALYHQRWGIEENYTGIGSGIGVALGSVALVWHWGQWHWSGIGVSGIGVALGSVALEWHWWHWSGIGGIGVRVKT